MSTLMAVNPLLVWRELVHPPSTPIQCRGSRSTSAKALHTKLPRLVRVGCPIRCSVELTSASSYAVPGNVSHEVGTTVPV